MTRKVFEVDEDDDRPPVQPEFQLGAEVFVCKSDREVSSLDVLDFIAGLTGDSGTERIRTVLRLFAFFLPADDGTPSVEAADGVEASPGTPSSMERFRDTVRRRRVRLVTLNDIASWVLDEYLRFPTEAAPPSSNGSTSAASSSVAVSSVPPDSTSPT
jgi:hypothetical protein